MLFSVESAQIPKLLSIIIIMTWKLDTIIYNRGWHTSPADIIVELTNWTFKRKTISFSSRVNFTDKSTGASFPPNSAGIIPGLWEERGMCVDNLFFKISCGLKQRGIDFHRYLTSANPRHRGHLEIQQQQGFNFLDLKIAVGRLHAPIYRKSSDRNTVLKADSWKFQRLRRTCSNDDVFDHRAEEMYRRFEQRVIFFKKAVLVQTLIKADFFKQKTPS